MQQFQIYSQADKGSAAAEAGEHLNRLLIANKNRPVLLMLSGGSALSILDYVGLSALGAHLTVSMLDERFTPFEARSESAAVADGNLPLTGFSHDSLINNFSQLQKLNFYKDAFEAEGSFFGTLPRPGETSGQLAQRWQANLKNWRAENPDGIIIATLGMGQDGHTAGMFPYPEDPKKFDQLFNSDDWVKAYDVGDKNPYSQRITATITFFKLINFGLAYVCGTAKKQKLDALLKHQGKVNEFPALAWQEIKDVKIFTDIK